MRESDGKGRFFVIEGIDGAGNSTQAYLLAKHLSECEIPVVATREPGGTPLGERIREILLDPHAKEMSPECELLLYMASRAQHVRDVLMPALSRGQVIVCERYLVSSFAYQAIAQDLPMDRVEEIGAFAVGDVVPDISIILDVDPYKAHERQQLAPSWTGGDRMENKGLEYQKRVRDAFLYLAGRSPERIKVIDASKPAKDVHKQVWRLVEDVL